MTHWGDIGRPSNPFFLSATAILAIWFAAILTIGGRGLFNTEMGGPPVNTLLALLGPPLLFLALLQIKSIRAEVVKLNPVWITAMQGLRILGGGFLFVYAFGHLPALFAYMAGIGDIIVAVLAPVFTAMLAMNRGFLRSKRLQYFHYLGLLDFVGAVGSGLVVRGTIPLLDNVESTAAPGQLPLVLIPCFAVPLWICLHIVALAQISDARKAANEA